MLEVHSKAGLRFESLKIADEGVYAGFIDHGLNRQILGVMFTKKGNTFEGEWKDDRFEGIGVQAAKTGKMYVGQHIAGLKHGIGRYQSDERQILGQFEKGATHGVAIMQLPSQLKKISGYFVNGQLNGFGIVKSKMHDKNYSLRAFFENGHANAIGIEKCTDKLYEGQFKNNNKTGVGQFSDPNYPLGAMRYLGYFESNNFTGFGIQKVGEEFSYEGGFKSGVKTGVGRLQSPANNCSYIGEFSDDFQQGFGKYTDEIGSYTGSWVNNTRNGLGGLKEQTRTYIGMWKDDMRHGVGNEYSKEFTYRGEWLRDVPHGRGLIETPDGVTRCVSFSNGVLVNEVEGVEPVDFMKGIEMIDVEAFKKIAVQRIYSFELFISEEIELVKKRFKALNLEKLQRAEAQFEVDIKQIKERFIDIMATMDKNREYFKSLVHKYGIDLERLSSMTSHVKLVRPNDWDPLNGEKYMQEAKINVKIMTPPRSTTKKEYKQPSVDMSFYGNSMGTMMNQLTLSPEISPDKKRQNQDFILDNVLEIKKQIGKVLSKPNTDAFDFTPNSSPMLFAEPPQPIIHTRTVTYTAPSDTMHPTDHYNDIFLPHNTDTMVVTSTTNNNNPYQEFLITPGTTYSSQWIAQKPTDSFKRTMNITVPNDDFHGQG